MYVFRRTRMAWQQEAYIKSSDTEVDSHFGGSVVLTEGTLAIGAATRNAGGVQRSGALYLFDAP